MAENQAIGRSSPSRETRRRRARLVIAMILLVGTAVIGVTAATPAGADLATYSSAQFPSGHTPTFYQSGPWTMSWSYYCSINILGGVPIAVPGSFTVTVNQPSGSSISDVGPNEMGFGGSGFDTYYDTGTFDLDVSGCNWSITVGPASGAPAATPLTITSEQVGSSGDTSAFFVGGPWTMAWSYESAAGSVTSCGGGSGGNFIVDVQRPLGGFTSDVGPNELGTGGSGVDSYTNGGTFSLAIDSDCQWSITISSSARAPASSPAPPAPAAKVFTDMAPTPDGNGYWIVDSQGDVYPEGDAVSHGSMTGQHLNADCPHRGHTRRRRLLDGGGGRRHLHLRGRSVLRVDGRTTPERPCSGP